MLGGANEKCDFVSRLWRGRVEEEGRIQGVEEMVGIRGAFQFRERFMTSFDRRRRGTRGDSLGSVDCIGWVRTQEET